MRRSEGKPNRSNSRSISPRNERHASGTGASASVAFFTSTGTSAITLSIFSCREMGFCHPGKILAASARQTLIWRNPNGQSGGEPGRPECLCRRRAVHLTGKEYGVLELLSLHKGTVVTKEMLLKHLYGGIRTRTQDHRCLCLQAAQEPRPGSRR
jgi:Transcriptional regulatory protein, C terminal